MALRVNFCLFLSSLVNLTDLRLRVFRASYKIGSTGLIPMAKGKKRDILIILEN
jgi:hypothetical protein